MSAPAPARRRTSPRQLRTTIVLAATILIPCMFAFGNKFREFVALFRGEVDGAFALSPILNYLLASLGFLCLFLWAIANGMFHDLEKPKASMLEIERQLDDE